MKKALILSTLALAVFACSRKTMATTESKVKTETAGGETKVKTETGTAAPDAQAALLAQGQVIYTSKCARCHDARPVDSYTAEQWTGILKSMIPKAKLTEAESAQVTAYVMAGARK
jgi:mono/diheme cytochrome c family protein